jgi:hypothetical protein
MMKWLSNPCLDCPFSMISAVLRPASEPHSNELHSRRQERSLSFLQPRGCSSNAARRHSRRLEACAL